MYVSKIVYQLLFNFIAVKLLDTKISACEKLEVTEENRFRSNLVQKVTATLKQQILQHLYAQILKHLSNMTV